MGGTASGQANVDLVKLRAILLERAVSDDLRIFCADLGVNYEEVVGPNDKLPIAILNLIKYLDSRDRIGELVARAKREFPSAAWAEAPGGQKEVTGSLSVTLEPLTAKSTATVARQPGPLRVFLCHASEDKAAVRALYQKLLDAGIQPWLDEEDLLPGQRWRIEIPKAIQACDIICVCLSDRSVKKDGYIKQEIQFVLDVADKQPEDSIFVIPLRLEECDVPERLREVQWVNLFDERGFARLLRSLNATARAVGADAVLNEAQPAPTPTAARPTNPARLVIESPIRLELVRIPLGEFLMGSDKSKDKDAYDDELPQHTVALDEFYIGKYPVTVAQFAAFVKAANYKSTAEQQGSAYVWNGKEWKDTKGANWQHPRGPKSDVAHKQEHPVTCVSWDDAMAFCTWLSQAASRTIQLPTEAQWEKAARSADSRIYPWGNEPPDEARCNFNMNVGDTTPVGQYSPTGDSPYGCADMAGNVWEWTRSLWGKDVSNPEFKYPYTDKIKERENVAAGSDYLRVLRGGGFSVNRRFVRCASRVWNASINRSDDDGFRVCSLPIHL